MCRGARAFAGLFAVRAAAPIVAACEACLGAQALSVAEFKALAYSKGHREPCAKRAPPRWALHRRRCPKWHTLPNA